MFYALDSATGVRTSLRTTRREDAEKILQARNQATTNSGLGMALAKAYLSACHGGLGERTWQQVMDDFCNRGQPQTQTFRKRKVRREPFNLIRSKTLIETTADDFMLVLKVGGVMDHAILRSLHNLALGMGWLPWPVLPARLWPQIRSQPKRGVTRSEHEQIIRAEMNLERRHYYELLWETGASQTDAVLLQAENVDWANRTLIYRRKKTGSVACLTIGPNLETLLRALPAQGPLFPKIIRTTENARSAEFYRRCKLLGLRGISLHSYRYAWAERAKTAGYPERFAQEALGHNSKAVHRAYAKGAVVKVPSLEDYEQRAVPAPAVRAEIMPQAAPPALPVPP